MATIDIICPADGEWHLLEWTTFDGGATFDTYIDGERVG